MPNSPPCRWRNADWSRRWSVTAGETTLAVFDHILRSSEAEARAVISALPDGVYRAEDVIDGDGVDPSKIPVQVVVRIAGDSMEVDFTGSSPARKAPINCSAARCNRR